MAEIKDEYIQWPGPATFPSASSTPAYDRYANGNTTVHSHKGWEWVEVDSPYQQAAASLAQAAIETAVQRASTVFGTVYYQRGNATDRPDFDGQAVGDTARIQDPQTLNIVAEWKWTGTSWERAQISSEQISNLDVGRLTAGSASINELAARKIAADTGKFLQLTTDQLTVTGNASFVDLTAKHVWAKIVGAPEGEFGQIHAGMIAANSISSDNLQVGALDGQVITGAQIQSDRAPNRGLKISGGGMQVYSSNGWKVLDINAQTGDIAISGRIGRRDTWSEVWFNDIVSRGNGLDEYSGYRLGCGLSFNSLQDDWWDGTISLRKASTGDPSLRIQAPYPKRLGNESPALTVGTSALSMYTPAGGGASFSFNNLGLSLQAQHVYWWMNDNGFSFGMKSDNQGRLYVGKNKIDIQMVNESQSRFWANDKTTTMQFNPQNQIWMASDGMHVYGTKRFIMQVPALTASRGGLWLVHAATESPYDGIEYWENLTLDSEGRAHWTLPDYVPRIASPKAPWIVLASGGARAALDRSNSEEWSVNVSGTPGETVAVLVKGARMINAGVDDNGEPVMRDYARESPWHDGPPKPPGDGSDSGGGGNILPAGTPVDGGMYDPDQHLDPEGDVQ